MKVSKALNLLVVVLAFLYTKVLSCPEVPTGYTLRNGKYYKIYHEVPTNYHEAKLACHEDGAHVAMMKTELDFNSAFYYANRLSGDIWVGLTNNEHSHCAKSSCIGKFMWDDGTMADASTIAHCEEKLNAGGKHYCLRMKPDDGEINDNNCHKNYAYLCQYDCDNPYVEDISCPGAPDDFDHIYKGKSYKTFYDTPGKDYAAAQETCRSLGGKLPTLRSYKEYISTRTIQGFGTQPIWLGMFPLMGDVECTSEKECQNKIFHYSPNKLPESSDDKIEPLGHNGWFKTPISIDTDDGKCMVMASIEDDHSIVSRDCGDPAVFACTVDCSESPCEWAGWQSYDTPNLNYDYETNIVGGKDRVCAGARQDMEVRRISDKLRAEDTGQVFFSNSPDEGFNCRNADQASGTCYDYETRLCCQVHEDLEDYDHCLAHKEDLTTIVVKAKGVMNYAAGKHLCEADGLEMAVLRGLDHHTAVKALWADKKAYYLDGKATGTCSNAACTSDNVKWQDGGAEFDYSIYQQYGGWVILDGDGTCMQLNKGYGQIWDVDCNTLLEVACMVDCRVTPCVDPVTPVVNTQSQNLLGVGATYLYGDQIK